MWGKGNEMLRTMLVEEHRGNPDASLLNLMDALCRVYMIPPVSKQELDRNLVKRQINLKDQLDIWVSNIMSPVTQNVGLERVGLSTNFFQLTKRESQGLMAFNAGALKLKTAWGYYHEIRTCLDPLCGGPDSLDHIKECPRYETKWEGSFQEDSKSLSKYLVSVDRERRRRWRGECLF